MVRAILAAMAGCAAIGIPLVFTDQIITLMSQGFNSTGGPVRFTLFSFLFGLLAGSSFCLLGGYVCASLAKQRARLATHILMVGGECIGIVAAIAYWKSVPHWFALTILVVFAACVRAGSEFKRRGDASMASL